MKLIEVILKGKFDVSFDSNLKFDHEKKYLTKKFINFCIDELGIEGEFNVKLVSEREKYGIKTTAFYRDICRVYRKYLSNPEININFKVEKK